ncbi:hypothetical protein BDV19DRAFT_391297 [Aspergillus venezuelensis]
MPPEYTSLCKLCPRSFLFAIVANVGPGRTARTLAIAYRQGNDDLSGDQTFVSRVDYFVSDTLALIDVLSDPANRAPLEAERALAEDWYRRSQSQTQSQSQSQSQFLSADKPHVSQRPSVPATTQPKFLVPEGYYWNQQTEPQPLLPWRAAETVEFPFTATCLILGLLRDDSDGEDYGTAARPKLKRHNHRTRPGDVQLQPLATVFRGDCVEYGIVVLDTSELDDGVKYGIVAFPFKYMDNVYHHNRIV